MADVSVVLISKNEVFLSATLTALKDQCDEVHAECVVVDASNGRLSSVRDAHDWVRWHDYVAPPGRGVTIPHQRNEGVALANGEVIAFCDAGGMPSEHWLSRLIAPIIGGTASATGGPIRSRRNTAYGTLNEAPSGAPLPSVVTSNFAFTKALFERVGGFDERYDYGSDGDFGWRIRELGEVVVSVPDAIMTIDWGDRRRQLKRDYVYGQAQARQWVLRPERRRKILLESPEVLAYPLLFLTTPPALVAALLTRRWVLLAPWVQAYAALYAWDRWRKRPHGAMLDHLVVSAGICRELAAAAFQGAGERDGPPVAATR
jgi:Glycosyl transferase family 2